MSQKFYTPKEVGKMTGKFYLTIIRWIKTGKIPAKIDKYPSGRVRYYVYADKIPDFLMKTSQGDYDNRVGE